MKVRLESNQNFHVPGWLVEATLQYRARSERQRVVNECGQIFCQGIQGPPPEAWHSLLSGEIPYTVKGGTVTFSYEE